MTRYARRVDKTQAEIVRALRAAGCSVASLHRVGGGVPDLLVGRAGVTYLLEAKRAAEPGHTVKNLHALTNELQDEWAARWRGRPVDVVRTVDEALKAVGATP